MQEKLHKGMNKKIHLEMHLRTLSVKGANGNLGSSAIVALGLGKLLSYGIRLCAISELSLPP